MLDSSNLNSKAKPIGILISPKKNYTTPYPDVVPQGWYESTIDEVVRINENTEDFLINYTLIDNHDNRYYIQMKYYEDSFAQDELYKALIRYGFPVNKDVGKAVGLTERLYLTYDAKKHYRFGFITKRDIVSLPPWLEYTEEEEAEEFIEEEEGE